MPRLLIISARFYPHPAVGAVRVTEWSRFLPDRGWSVVVACRNYGYTASPGDLGKAVHPAVELRYLNATASTSGDDFKLKKERTLRQRIGASPLAKLAVPDLSVVFWRSKRSLLESIVAETRPDVILTSSPPHAIHGAGLWLKKRTGIAWIADFRDPYLFDPRYQPTGMLRSLSWLHRRYEALIYERATLVLHAIPAHARSAAQRYRSARIETLTNGAPPELLAGSIDPICAPAGRKSVRIVGKGGSTELRNIAVAIRAMLDRDVDIELRIVGYAPPNREELAAILADRLILTGPKAHPEALREIAGADVLVAPLSLDRSNTLLLSSKLFEYLAAGRPVILLNPTVPDEELSAGLPAVSILKAPDPVGIQHAISAALATSGDVLQRQRAYVSRHYSRDQQTTTLVSLLESAAASSRAKP